MGGFITGICTTIILMQVPKLMGGTAGVGELFELAEHIAEKMCIRDSVFTEQGLYMLMIVLKGPLAVKQSKALILSLIHI